jgi:hypothetical protein
MIAALKIAVFVTAEVAALCCLIGAHTADPLKGRFDLWALGYATLFIGGFVFGVATDAL